jgi:Na+/H+ antiporter NhaD/arsenite permease-like protein
MRQPNLQRFVLLAILGGALVFVLAQQSSLVLVHAKGVTQTRRLSLIGRLHDPQGEPISGASVLVMLDGTATDQKARSQTDGTFVVDVPSDAASDVETLSIEISRPHFRALAWEAGSDQIDTINQGNSLRLPDIEMKRRVTPAFWVATITFIVILVIIALELLNNAMAALLGVAVIMGVSLVGGAVDPAFFIFDFDGALEYVNFEVIFLVMGMMIVIGVVEETGIFQWLAYQSYRLSRGRGWLLVTILMVITSVASALLDNVTTMLLMTPITIHIAAALAISPLSLLIPQVLASNVGGITTLIGTPTNILIGSFAGLSFSDFLTNLTPGALLAQAALTVYVIIHYRKQLLVRDEGLSKDMLEKLAERGQITKPIELRKAAIVFGMMLVFFALGEQIHLVPAVTAIIGAVALVLWATPTIDKMLKVVDWTTLMFFIALFIVVGAIQEVGLVGMIADAISQLVAGNLVVAVLAVVWSAAFLSGVIANIPFTAAMLPVVSFLTRTIPGASSQVLFYALSIGAAMGGNSSLIGASANVVTAGMAAQAGYRITYVEFLRIGMPAMIITVAVGTLWLFIRF